VKHAAMCHYKCESVVCHGGLVEMENRKEADVAGRVDGGADYKTTRTVREIMGRKVGGGGGIRDNWVCEIF